MADLWNPNQYEKFKDQRSQPFRDLVSLCRRSEGIKSFIDLGCGTGELTAWLHAQLASPEALGIDSSHQMLKKAEANTRPGLIFKAADITQFETRQKFDLVISNAALQWIPDHETLFPKLLSLVSPQGQIAIQMPCNFDHPSHQLAVETARNFKELQEEATVLSILPLEAYALLLHQAGFTENCFVKVYLHPMQSPAEIVEWTKGSFLTKFQKKLTPERFETFIQSYREALLTKMGTGPCVYTFKRMFLWGTPNQPT